MEIQLSDSFARSFPTTPCQSNSKSFNVPQIALLCGWHGLKTMDCSSQMKVVRKRVRVLTNKRWTEAEEGLILDYLLELAPRNKEFEKPNRRVFYQTMTDELKLSVADSSQTMSKVRNLRASYTKTVDWKSNTGQGVESGSIDEYVRQICPYFHTLEEIFGHKMNIVPLSIYESGRSDLNIAEESEVRSDDHADNPNIYDVNDENILGHPIGLTNSDMIDLNEVELRSVEDNESCTADDCEKLRYKRALQTAPVNIESTPLLAKENIDDVSRFKKRLLACPVGEKEKNMARNSASILAEAQNKKAEAIFGRNEIEKTKAGNEKHIKLEEIALAKENLISKKKCASLIWKSE
ncbi:hypothetical protein Bhyg_12583 [Pseudolycoriella hygida]|uniref:Myb/SANT-like domain-containing protein n=1 Tax=Pseudolycoriella hygida TaxID=35572 RepID=A0A9Q0MXH9_9DIPT|nr:hypothetical protein Bhyg_12583 [Pseudolycoriella hygida]